MKTSDAVSELFAALAKAQGEMENPKENQAVDFINTKNQRVKYTYADLQTCIAAERKVLSKNGLSVSQIVEHDRITTILAHQSGQWMAGEFLLPKTQYMDAKAFASDITYFRRYCYCGMLGIASDGDTDGEHAEAPPPGEKPPGEKQPGEKRPPIAPVSQAQKAANQGVVGTGPSEAMIRRLWAIAGSAGWSDADVHAWIDQSFRLKSVRDLTRPMYEKLCEYIQMTPNVEPGSSE